MAKRKVRTRFPVADVDSDDWLIMTDRPPENPFSESPVSRQTWERHCDRVLAEWVRVYPGTRPSHWWRYSAPEPRQRLGGQGTPITEVSAIKAGLFMGIPSGWLDRAWVEDARARGDTRLNYSWAIDPGNPPIFEGEAAYLARLRLFLKGERTRTPRELFEPVSIEGGPFETRICPVG